MARRVVAPYRVASPAPAAPRGSNQGRRVSAGSTDRPLGYAAQWQRAGERLCVRGHPAPVHLRRVSVPSSPVNGGPGGRRLRAPFGARRSRPPAIFSPLLDRSKRGSPPAGGEIPPNQKARCKTGGRGQAPPLRGSGYHISRNGRPHGAASTKKHRKYNVEPTAGASPRPTWLHHTGTARQGCRALHPLPRKAKRAPRDKQREVALPPIRETLPKIAHSHTFIGNYAPPCPFTNASLSGLARPRDFRYIRSVDFLPLPADRTAGIIGGTLKKEGLYVGHHFESSPGQRGGEAGI